jgi:hypothetical protein
VDQVFYSYFSNRLTSLRQAWPRYTDVPESEQADAAVSAALEETTGFAVSRGRILRPDARLFHDLPRDGSCSPYYRPSIYTSGHL